MPCINDTPQEELGELERQNQRLTGALCAALRSLHALYTRTEQIPAMDISCADLMVNLEHSGVNARWLKDWWHRHLEMDQVRREQASAAEARARLRDQALAKLTPAERAALGHPVEKTGTAKHQVAAPFGRRNQGMPGGDV